MIPTADLSKLGFLEFKRESGENVFVNIAKQITLFPNGEGFIPYYGPIHYEKGQCKGVMITELSQLLHILS